VKKALNWTLEKIALVFFLIAYGIGSLIGMTHGDGE
jgi:hypothetical protein